MPTEAVIIGHGSHTVAPQQQDWTHLHCVVVLHDILLSSVQADAEV